MRLFLTTAILVSLAAPAYADSERVYVPIDGSTSISEQHVKPVFRTLNFPSEQNHIRLNNITQSNIYDSSIYGGAPKQAPSTTDYRLNKVTPAAGIPTGYNAPRIKLPTNNIYDASIYGASPKQAVTTSSVYTTPSSKSIASDIIQPAPSSMRAKKRRSLKPRVELNHRYSNDRAITMSEFWVPLAQDERVGSVLYGDLRLMGDNNSNKEFNAGLGYRKLARSKLLGDGIAGGTLWYDRRHTDRGSKFNQVTLGGEWLGKDYDIRSNVYLPLNDSKKHTQANPNTTALGFVGSQILVNTDQTVIEEALIGADIEVGKRIKALDNITDATRIYAGAYHFEGHRAEDVTGVRARIASDITQDIQIGARVQHDDVRDSQAYLEATIRFPFKSKKSFRQEGIRSRLDESPERDIDIVHNEAIADDGVNKAIFNANTGTTQNVVHVDNTAGAGGDGTIETPFNTLAAAEAAAVAHDLIYVHRGDGTTTGQDAGITIDDEGQILAGTGADLLFLRSFLTLILIIFNLKTMWLQTIQTLVSF